MTNQLIRGYTNCGFEAWTVPCLYVAGKYLRIFAIKADEATGNNTGVVTTFQDDFNPEAEKNEKLEDAARQLNRIFQICLADRFATPASSSLGHQLIISQSPPRGFKKMGHLQYYQFVVQDLFQIELDQFVEEYP